MEATLIHCSKNLLFLQKELFKILQLIDFSFNFFLCVI